MIDEPDTERETNRHIERRRIAPSRYDLVLAAIPLAFLLSVAGSVVASVPLKNALLGGAALGAVALADALFGHPPTGNGRV